MDGGVAGDALLDLMLKLALNASDGIGDSAAGVQRTATPAAGQISPAPSPASSSDEASSRTALGGSATSCQIPILIREGCLQRPGWLSSWNVCGLVDVFCPVYISITAATGAWKSETTRRT